MKPKFEIADLGEGCSAINEHGRTVAIVTRVALVDWLIWSPDQPGELISNLYKETHLSYTLGLKFQINTISPETHIRQLEVTPSEDGSEVVLRSKCESANGKFRSLTSARLYLGADGRYEWELDTRLENTSQEVVPMENIEYNNVYPSKAGRCMLYTPQKEYSSTLMIASDGVVWDLPHQHMFHYGDKLRDIHFANGTLAGFFSSPAGAPVVVVNNSSHSPSWSICDMYYDLHCLSLTNEIQPGEVIANAYTIKYILPEEASLLAHRAVPVPITDEDWRTHDYPRIELGMNQFTQRCNIDRPDDCSGFRPAPAKRVWDRDEGNAKRGSLRLTNAVDEETVWSAEPPTLIPPSTVLGITALVKTQGVIGKGLYVRVKFHTFHWKPEPHVEWVRIVESVPVTGTTDGWQKITVPSLRVEENELDYLVQLDVVLDGTGVAWVTDVDVDLVSNSVLAPANLDRRPLTTA